MTIFHENEEKQSFFHSLRPKHAYFLGLASGIAVMFVIGFFFMLISVFGNGEGFSWKKSADTGKVAVNQPTDNPADDGEPTNIKVNPVTNKDWVKGNKNAKVSVVVYTDTECPFCKRHHPVLNQLLDTYKDKINLVYRAFPLVQLHSKAPKEAEAIECAGDQGGSEAAWKYLDKIFEVTPSNDGLDPAQLSVIAGQVGLNVDKFKSCYDSGKFTSKIKKSTDEAVAAGARGTPYNVILAGDQKIPVSGALPLENFKQILDPLVK